MNKKIILLLLAFVSMVMSACSESSDNSNYSDGYTDGAKNALKETQDQKPWYLK